MVPDFLITGTDTGVGKTVVAAALLLALRERGMQAVGFKPAETGLVPGEAADSDILAEAGGDRRAAGGAAAAPGGAAGPGAGRGAGRRGVRPAMVAEARVSALRDIGYCVVVEGAGGLTVPLAWGYTVLDLAVRTGLHAVVVGLRGSGRSTTASSPWRLSSAAACRSTRSSSTARSDPLDVAESTNPAALARLLPGLRILVLPRLPRGDAPPWRAAAALLTPLLDA